MALRVASRSLLTNCGLSNCYTSGVSYQATRCYALKSPVPIKWVRPEKVPCIKPEKSGDLAPLEPIDLKNTVPLEFRDCQELKDAPELVKRLFTLEYFPHKKTVAYLRQYYVDMVKKHKLDYHSPEARAARMTVDIRDMQREIERHVSNKRLKVRLKETIDKRRKLLRRMRNWDYKKYEWLLEKLNLFYKPQPKYQEVYLRVERKRSMRMLTKSYCDNIVNSRLDAYRKSLEDQQEQFLESKVQTLEWIMKEEAECEGEPSVTQEEVEKAKLQLREWRDKKTTPTDGP